MDLFTDIQVLKGPCAIFSVQYRFDNQGSAEWQKPMELKPGQLVSFNGGKSEKIGPYKDLTTVDMKDLSILTHFRYDLGRVSCAAF